MELGPDQLATLIVPYMILHLASEGGFVNMRVLCHEDEPQGEGGRLAGMN